MTEQTRARLKMVGVFMIFLVPLAGAYLLYYGLSYGSAGTNKGKLVDPAQRLPQLTLRDAEGHTQPSGQVFARKWTVLQIAPKGCEQACLQSLDETRQIRALLHRRATRVQRLLLVGDGQSLPQLDAQPDLDIFQADTGVLTRVFEQEGATAPGMVYLVDPLGNWMLYYPPGGDGEALFDDVKHLLKLSHIG